MSSETKRMINGICFSFAIMLCDDNLFEGEWRIYVVMALWVVILSDFEHKKLEK